MASIRAQAERRHSVSKHKYVERLRTVAKEDSKTSCDRPPEKSLEQQDKLWLTHDSNRTAVVYRITVRREAN